MPAKLNQKANKSAKTTTESSSCAELPGELTSTQTANAGNGNEDADDDSRGILAAIRSLGGELITMKEEFTSRFDSILGAVNAVQGDLKILSNRVTTAEQRLSAAEDELSAVSSQLTSTASRLQDLTRKVDDLENRSRRSNLRLVGLPENREEGDMCAFLEKWIPNMLGEHNFPRPLIIERAHRVGSANSGGSSHNKPDTRPRVVLMKFLNDADKVRVMKAARSKGDILVDGRKVMFFPDLSADLLKRRKAFDPVKKELSALKLRDLRYGIIHPATLLVTVGGRRHTFDKVTAAERFVRGLKLDSGEASLEAE